ncbi:MAG TPA: hypothetical protein VFA09_17225 [Ktedonobacteraceae bacterium]|nr:hypothetical protein [Ktedonobacteraceae bacterium]
MRLRRTPTDENRLGIFGRIIDEKAYHVVNPEEIGTGSLLFSAQVC